MKRFVVIAAAVSVLAACQDAPAPSDAASSAPTADATSAEPATPQSAGESSLEVGPDDLPSPEPVVAPECQDGPDRTVTQLEDDLLPGMVIEDVVIPEVELPDGTVLPGSTIDAGVVEPATVDAGCIIEFDAPGGCLPRVEVTEAVMPERVIPGITIPERSVPGGPTQPEVVVEPIVVEERRFEGFVLEQSCIADRSGRVTQLFRPGGFRLNSTTTPSYRYADYVPKVCEGEICLPRVKIPEARTETMALPMANIESQTVEAEPLSEDVQVFEDDRTSYVAPADVLFDIDSDQLRDGAEVALRAIAQDLRDAIDGGAELVVEGHTDDTGTEAYNQDLSLRRAEAVAAWLVDNATIDPGRIQTVGLGETTPAAPNDTEEGRQQNRRVVVSTTD